ncbi:MAG: response regulator transcription factor [Pseudomonadota bacterium]
MTGRVVIADDHPLFRAALRSAVAAAAPGRDIVEADSLSAARDRVAEAAASLLCLDLHMKDSDGFAGLMGFRQEHPALPVAVVSGSEEPSTVARAIAAGAAAFIPKSTAIDAIREAVAAVLDGDVWTPPGFDPDAMEAGEEAMERLASLTPTQLKVLVRVRDGLLNKQIAFEMNISEATVKAHLTSIFRKLSVQTRTQAVLAAETLAVERPSAS